MIQTTKDYSIFKFRPDNRSMIMPSNITKLIEEINNCNLLHLNPVIVNADMEIIDGQHRILAAKALNLDVYYMQDNTLTPGHMLSMQRRVSWSLNDFVNFHCHAGNQHYIRFREFMKKNGLDARTAFRLCFVDSHKVTKDFKNGLIEFNDFEGQEFLSLINDTLSIIFHQVGHKAHLKSGKFWKTLLFFFKHGEIELEKWFRNVEHLAQKFAPRTCEKDYLEIIEEVYNFKNKKPVKAVRLYEDMQLEKSREYARLKHAS